MDDTLDEHTVPDLYAEGDEYQRQINVIFNEQYNGDVNDPGWFEFCKQMDEWVAATTQ